MLHAAENDYKHFPGLPQQASEMDVHLTVDVGDDEVIVYFDYVPPPQSRRSTRRVLKNIDSGYFENMVTMRETSRPGEAQLPVAGGSPPPVPPNPRRRLRRVLRWLGHWLDVRRTVPWWRRQGATVRAIVVVGLLVGWLAPAAMVRHGWHSAEIARGLTGDQGYFTATTCDHIYPSNEGNPGQYYICEGAYDSPSTRLTSTRAQSSYDLSTGAPTRAHIVDHQIETVDNKGAAGAWALWTTLAFLFAVFEATVLSVLVLVVRGGPHNIGPGMRVLITTLTMIPAAFVVVLVSDLAFRIYFGLSS